MRRFTRLITPALVVIAVTMSLTAPARAQYPAQDPNRKSRTPKAGLTRLQAKAPGHSAVVTMNDGTLRGGWVTTVDDAHLNMEKQGEKTSLALSDVVSVRVQRPDHTLLYGMIGYLVTGTVATIIAYNDGDHEFKDLVIVGGV